MISKEKKYGLPGIIEGTTASDAELMDQARAAVARKLGIDARSMVERKDQTSGDHGYLEQDLYTELPIKKEKPIVVKDKFGHTPEEKAAMIHKHLTRPADPYAAANRKKRALLAQQQAAKKNGKWSYQGWANDKVERLTPVTEDQKEAADFWKGYNDPTGKKMVSHINNMNKKYNYPEEASPEQMRGLEKRLNNARQMTGHPAAKHDEEMHPAEKYYDDEIKRIIKKGKSITLPLLNKDGSMRDPNELTRKQKIEQGKTWQQLHALKKYQNKISKV